MTRDSTRPHSGECTGAGRRFQAGDYTKKKSHIAIRPETKKRAWPWSGPILNPILKIEAPADRSAEAEAAADAALRELDAAR